MSMQDPSENNPNDLPNPDNYGRDFEISMADRIKKILEVPAIDDMAGIFIRGIFKNEKQLNAALRLAKRHIKFKDEDNQEVLRIKIAGMAGIGGTARLEALFGSTNMIASDMYRVARGMPKLKDGKEEKVIHSNDYRSNGRSQENSGNS